MNKYTYQDWWEGKIYLAYAGISFSQSEINNLPPAAQWDNINETDIAKIKKKQKELFEIKRKELFNKWCKIFIEKYINSELKEYLLHDEIEDFYDILFNRGLEGAEIIRLRNHDNMVFDTNELFSTQRYALNIIKNGNKINYDFIHSPNFKYQRKDIIAPAEIYAQALWDYIKWLKNFQNKPEDYLGGRNILPKDEGPQEIYPNTNKLKEKPMSDYISEADAKKMFHKSTTWFWNKRKKGLTFSKVGGTVYYSLAAIKKYFEMGE